VEVDGLLYPGQREGDDGRRRNAAEADIVELAVVEEAKGGQGLNEGKKKLFFRKGRSNT
jgi:hypothetical protein